MQTEIILFLNQRFFWVPDTEGSKLSLADPLNLGVGGWGIHIIISRKA
jgi:hypothetical protein